MAQLREPERGQSLLEVALALPILLLLLLGIIEVGRYAQLAIVVADAARAGAIYGAQSSATAGQTDNAADQSGNNTSPPNGIEVAAQTDANLGTNLSVNSCSEVLPGSTTCSTPMKIVVSPCATVSDGGTPVPYIIVRTSYTAHSLFTGNMYTLNGCAQMQIAE
jgi:Flp pilus assembly protein TadG